ncbi:MAG TPA: hypothetical protein ENI98_10625 [Gammaproteobacteria bacterium]|nr:hypothetical protein [Gammaproteobacteria bacterium]
MTEIQAIMRVVANDEETARRVMFYLDGDTRPNFEDEVPDDERAIFTGLEFSDTPIDIKRSTNYTVDAWFESINPNALEEMLSALNTFELRRCYVFLADDEEYKAYFTYEKGALEILYSSEEDPELDAMLWELGWGIEAMELVIERKGNH